MAIIQNTICTILIKFITIMEQWGSTELRFTQGETEAQQDNSTKVSAKFFSQSSATHSYIMKLFKDIVYLRHFNKRPKFYFYFVCFLPEKQFQKSYQRSITFINPLVIHFFMLQSFTTGSLLCKARFYQRVNI